MAIAVAFGPSAFKVSLSRFAGVLSTYFTSARQPFTFGFGIVAEFLVLVSSDIDF
jgi:nicotinamide riboside transporter PnuC